MIDVSALVGAGQAATPPGARAANASQETGSEGFSAFLNRQTGQTQPMDQALKIRLGRKLGWGTSGIEMDSQSQAQIQSALAALMTVTQPVQSQQQLEEPAADMEVNGVVFPAGSKTQDELRDLLAQALGVEDNDDFSIVWAEILPLQVNIQTPQDLQIVFETAAENIEALTGKPLELLPDLLNAMKNTAQEDMGLMQNRANLNEIKQFTALMFMKLNVTEVRVTQEVAPMEALADPLADAAQTPATVVETPAETLPEELPVQTATETQDETVQTQPNAAQAPTETIQEQTEPMITSAETLQAQPTKVESPAETVQTEGVQGSLEATQPQTETVQPVLDTVNKPEQTPLQAAKPEFEQVVDTEAKPLAVPAQSQNLTAAEPDQAKADNAQNAASAPVTEVQTRDQNPAPETIQAETSAPVIQTETHPNKTVAQSDDTPIEESSQPQEEPEAPVQPARDSKLDESRTANTSETRVEAKQAPSKSDTGAGKAGSNTQDVPMSQVAQSAVKTPDIAVEATPVPEARSAQATDMIRQIVTQVYNEQGETVTKLEMQLHPASLGRIVLALERTSEGVSVTLKSASDSVREILAGHMADLQSALKDAGINMKDLRIEQPNIGWDMARGTPQQNEGRSSRQDTGSGARRTARAIPRATAIENHMAAFFYGTNALQPQQADVSLDIRA